MQKVREHLLTCD